jgi:hypothetical protein
MSDQKIVTELKVSGHLMKLETGLYCVFHTAADRGPNPATGLPGVRISLPPGAPATNGGVEISGFRDDGWVSTGNDAALIRVADGPAHVLVTVYQSALGTEALPQLQVVRLGDIRPTGALGTHAAPLPVAAARPAPVARPAPGLRPAPAPQPGPGAPPAAAAATAPPEATDQVPPSVTAHVQQRGDVNGRLGDWLGERGSKLWIEGFSLLPPPELRAEELEYQAVLGRGWLSPWSQGGQFCGSRRMALPVLGLKVRLRGPAADAFECAYSASSTDGSMVGPVGAGEACEADNLAPLEAFQVIVRARRPAARPVPPPRPAAVAPGSAPPRPLPHPASPPQAGKPPPGKPGHRPGQQAAGKRPGKPTLRRR